MTEKERHVAANDNAPRDAGEFTTLAERRAWLETLPDKALPVMAWPTIERLSRLASPNAARALYSYAALMDPARIPLADNDNDPAAPVMDLELRHEVRPSISETMRGAEDDLSITFATRAEANSGWRITTEGGRLVAYMRGAVHVGALIFRNGALASWGKTARGKDLKPVERQRQPKGAARAPRSEVRIRELLPESDNTPIAKGAFWFGGLKGRKGTGTKPDIGDHAAAEEMARNQRRQAVRLALGDKCWILDAAITDATAREIGELLGHLGKTAERRGIAAINDALEHFQKIAA